MWPKTATEMQPGTKLAVSNLRLYLQNKMFIELIKEKSITTLPDSKLNSHQSCPAKLNDNKQDLFLF